MVFIYALLFLQIWDVMKHPGIKHVSWQSFKDAGVLFYTVFYLQDGSYPDMGHILFSVSFALFHKQKFTLIIFTVDIVIRKVETLRIYFCLKPV